MKGSQQLEGWIAGGERRRLAGHGIFVRTAIFAGRPPLLLVHGYPTAAYDWVHMWAGLSGHYSLYALDLLGFGSSDKPARERYPISLQADLCQALLDEFGVGVTHVLAHDYGDTVGQELIAREREGRVRIASIVFLNGGLFPETHRPRPIQRLLANPVLGPLLARSMSYARFERNMLAISGRHPPSRSDLEDLWLLIGRDGGQLALARLISYMEQRRRNRERWVGALIASNVPRKLICGAVDPISGAHLAARYRELVPDAEITLLEGVGHYPQFEEPGRVLDEYLRFRARLA